MSSSDYEGEDMECFGGGKSSAKGNRDPVKLTDEDLDFLSQHTASSREQLQAHFDNFIAKHPNGHITKKDFRAIMKNCFPRSDFDILEKRIFNMYDENRDGHISFKELMMVMYIMSSGSPEQNLKQIFRV